MADKPKGPRKFVAKKRAAHGYRGAKTGQFVVRKEGTDSKHALINKYPGIVIQDAPGQLKVLSKSELSSLVKLMKVG